MILAIDAGNSRIKWGLRDGPRWRARGWRENCAVGQLAALWRPLPPPRQIIVANVAGDAMKTALRAQLQHWPTEPHWVTAQREQCGVKNGYDDPARLGGDRWAALIAAWGRLRRGCVVANVGTAVTVDALNDHGEFLGGFIVPGSILMRHALAANTAGIDAGDAPAYQPYPRTTDNAVYSGGLAAIAGAIERMTRQIAQRDAAPPCLLGGGGAASVAPLLPFAAEIIDNLVLDGLIRIARTCS
ncbi:MAG TPA: type III pantothenate kinase [Betaproteobacteria bacterium]|nr:type III pantothenate kinase [Betaproteobacteria bacterium]